MKKIFYEKVGRRYLPVMEYASEVMDAFPQGDHLVSVRRNRTSRRYRIDPALAPMVAAGLYAEDAIVEAIHRSLELKPRAQELTVRQRELLEELTRTMNEQDLQWLGASARAGAEAGVEAMQAEADRLMKNTAVRKAYEHFLLMCKLTEEKKS